MSVRAYQQAAQRSEPPRDLEYRLLGEVTRALIDAAALDPTDFAGRIDALDWNRRVWSALANDCASDGNALPAPVRAQIISLSIWVGRHTSAVMRREAEIEALIDVNRAIMQGLAPSTVSSSAA
jgi:flagellar biosynthesis activator protein FlaF